MRTFAASALAAVFLSFVTVPPRAAARAAPKRRETWNLPRVSTDARGAEKRAVEVADLAGAGRRIAEWMEAHDGGPEDPEHQANEMRTTRWTLPRERLSDFDYFLDGLGTQKDEGDRGNAAVASGVDAQALRSRRENLLADMESMSGRLPALPAVSRLVTAYVASIDSILAAVEAAGEKTTVEVTLLGGPGPAGSPPGAPPPVPDWNPVDPFRWNSVRVPVGRAVEGEAYLSWATKPLPDLIARREVQVVLRVADLERGRAALTALMKKTGARGGAFAPAHEERSIVQVAGVAHQADPAAGYWIPRTMCDGLRAELSAVGEVASWEEFGHRSAYIDGDLVHWKEELRSEVEGEDDRLSPYRTVQALVMDQLRRLEAADEVRLRAEGERLYSIRLARKL